jgi:hypothetical protein
VLLDVISANEGDGFHSRFSYFTMPMTEATDVPEQFNVGNVQKRVSGESQMLQFGFGPIVTKNT